MNTLEIINSVKQINKIKRELKNIKGISYQTVLQIILLLNEEQNTITGYNKHVTLNPKYINERL